jgi:polyhydroxyalkanoate synthesis repressor PhaR
LLRNKPHQADPRREESNVPARQGPIAIKKYANRRLYHTGTSTYVTLDDLAKMVRDGEDFQVTDAKSGEDITRNVLAQIIFEEESKEGGQNLLPSDFLKQLIRFYGDSLQALIPSYLQMTMQNLAAEQNRIREQMAKSMGANPFTLVEAQTRRNMTMFMDAFRMFSPFPAGSSGPQPEAADGKSAEAGDPGLDEMRRQLAAMQARLDQMGKK